MIFFKTKENRVPVEEFLESLNPEDACRVLWMLKFIKESDWLPAQYAFEHTEDDDLMEFRISSENRNYWALAFRHKNSWVLFNGDFSTRFQKAPEKELKRATKNKESYTTGFRVFPVSDLKKYITVRKQKNEDFAEQFDQGYIKFRLGTTLRQIREKAGLTQKEASEKLDIAASLISQIENHAEKFPFSRLEEYLAKLRKSLRA